MKKLILILLIASFAFSLQSLTPAGTIGSFAVADTTYKNPNGSSELALLMREMQQYTADARKAVLANKPPAAYPKAFEKLHTAQITKGMSKSEHYDAFADVYLTGVKSYVGSAATERVAAYNSMVSGCIACHSQHCQGPVPVIKKLLIPTGQ